MSGHSKWAQIKHKKAKVDAQRGKIFGKLIREIMVAARMGGGNPEFNPRLRMAIEKAKSYNMPWDNIERAIKKGTGELEGQAFEQVVYEGYGPGGAAIMVVALTDNKNRTAGEIRHIFTKYGGNMGGAGSVAWQFEEKGVIYVDREAVSEDEILEVVLDAGAEDVKVEEDSYTIISSPKDFENVKKALDEKKIPYTQAEVTMLPKSQVKVEAKKAEQLLRLIEALEDQDDVQNVYSNFDIPDETLKAFSEAS
ncbi:MAG: YebC/PmpR family DNA-binding transcriptional regulator [Candidatus Hydrothermae bacterium]|nr:YebC/PmpR family DNA-binding transcriptional regulator [Candidatus Hydrothermae bacterium]